mmetsp:Transcript_2184/g.7371  ORF Transcript_2184/g.7371 Transcript_2184/m.7371 type:complete len:256 (-) Transcript_2184:278-1045(-)
MRDPVALPEGPADAVCAGATRVFAASAGRSRRVEPLDYKCRSGLGAVRCGFQEDGPRLGDGRLFRAPLRYLQRHRVSLRRRLQRLRQLMHERRPLLRAGPRRLLLQRHRRQGHRRGKFTPDVYLANLRLRYVESTGRRRGLVGLRRRLRRLVCGVPREIHGPSVRLFSHAQGQGRHLESRSMHGRLRRRRPRRRRQHDPGTGNRRARREQRLPDPRMHRQHETHLGWPLDVERPDVHLPGLRPRPPARPLRMPRP